MVNIFLTGATGFVGGDTLYTILGAHPDYHISCLVRSHEKGALLLEKYPSVRPVYGDLNDDALLADEASKADIICHLADCESVGPVKAIAEGLMRQPNYGGYLIHLSGSDIVCSDEIETGQYGGTSDQVFDDLNDITDLISLKPNAPHSDVDSIVINLGKITKKTAIVCPSMIYGIGRGPGNRHSIQIPEMVMQTLKRGSAPYVGEGRNIWSTVHIHDLTALLLKLIEDAAVDGDAMTWGENAYYFVENGEAVWGDVAVTVAKEAEKQGHMKKANTESLSAEEADRLWHYGTLLWGTNSRCRASRARKLGWRPVAPSFSSVLPATVAHVSKSLM